MMSKSHFKFPILIYLSILAALLVVVGLSVFYLPFSDHKNAWFAFPDWPWLDGWTRWDGGWYRDIAGNGFFYDPSRQSSVCFFPAYPILMRLLGYFTGNVLLAGIAISIVCGIGVSILFYRWCYSNMGSREARASLLLLLCYPFSLYFYGVVYSEALLVFCALLAFYFIENDNPVMAGIAGAYASATKLVGIAVAAGLVIRILEKRGIIGSDERCAIKWRDFGVLLAILGLVGYFGFLWLRFDEPLAYFKGSASGWGWGLTGYQTLFKFKFFERLYDGFGGFDVLMIFHLAITVVAVSLLPSVYRFFGWSYFIYSAVIISIPLISTPDFYEMGRHTLPAFPCFAAAGKILSQRKFILSTVLAGSFICLVMIVSLFARWYFVA